MIPLWAKAAGGVGVLAGAAYQTLSGMSGGLSVTDSLLRWSPPLAFMLVLVVAFGKFLERKEKREEAAAAAKDALFASTIQGITEKHDRLAERQGELIERNTEALGELNGVLQSLGTEASDRRRLRL